MQSRHRAQRDARSAGELVIRLVEAVAQCVRATEWLRARPASLRRIADQISARGARGCHRRPINISCASPKFHYAESESLESSSGPEAVNPDAPLRGEEDNGRVCRVRVAVPVITHLPGLPGTAISSPRCSRLGAAPLRN